jgi:hypothetical protein
LGISELRQLPPYLSSVAPDDHLTDRCAPLFCDSLCFLPPPPLCSPYCIIHPSDWEPELSRLAPCVLHIDTNCSFHLSCDAMFLVPFRLL